MHDAVLMRSEGRGFDMRLYKKIAFLWEGG